MAVEYAFLTRLELLLLVCICDPLSIAVVVGFWWGVWRTYVGEVIIRLLRGVVCLSSLHGSRSGVNYAPTAKVWRMLNHLPQARRRHYLRSHCFFSS